MSGRVQRLASRLARLWGALSLTPVFSFAASAIAVASAITDRYPATFTAVIVAIGGTGFAVTLNKAVRDALLPIASLLSSISGALLAIVFGLSRERPGLVDSSLAVLLLVSLGSALGVVSAVRW